MSHGSSLLEVRNLRVEFPTRWGPLTAIDNVSFSLQRGEVLGVVGESGAGKTLTGAAITGLLPPPARITAGSVHLEGERIDNLSQEQLRRQRGRVIGTIFQDPLTSLNPLFTIGDQLEETIRTHLRMKPHEVHDRALGLLREVGLPDPEVRFNSYPHEFSGGMRQRVVIALALSANPRLLIADEPTTALDVSVQAEIIALLRRVRREHDTAIMLITHDIGVIAEIADRVAVLYAGRVVEIGPTRTILKDARHPYSVGLMNSIPRIGSAVGRLPQIEGSMPGLGAAVSPYCAFRPRCARAFGRCSERPSLVRVSGSEVACWHYANDESEASSYS